MEIIMAVFQWTGSASTGDFSTANNWSPAAGAPPGPTDMAQIEGAAVPITGTGNPQILYISGTVKLAGHFTAAYGSPVNAQQLTLLPGAVLTTPMLHFVVSIQSPAPPFGNMTVGVGSALVIAGSHTPDNYAIEMSELGGSNSSLVVEGAGAVVNGGNLPMSVGQAGPSLLTIRDGAVVSVGNADPLIYPWCLVIGNHAGSSGTVQVQRATLLGHGQIIVGRNASGTLNVDEGGLVVAEDLAIGWDAENPQVPPPTGGIGAVTVKGRDARLIVDNQLEVQHMGTGSLTIADHGFVSAGISILVNGTLSLANGVIDTQALGVNGGGTLSGHGTVIAAQGIANNGGTITAVGKLILIGDVDNAAIKHGSSMTVAANGELQCFGALTDDGTLSLQAHSVASLEAVAAGQTISFGGSHARLVLRSPGVFGGSISGFAATHKIVVEAEVTSIAFGGGEITMNGPGGLVGTLLMNGPYDPPNLHLDPGFPGVITVA
jgi:T5SS/PEP-CTERM-associated repeat protein